MSELFRTVLPLALGAAISPTVLTVSVLLLSSKERPVARGISYLLGFLTVLAGYTALGLTVFDSVQHQPSSSERAVSDAVDVVIGIVLLLMAIRAVVRRRNGDDGDTPKPPKQRSVSLTAAFVTGIVMMLTNITSIVLYIPAMKDINHADVSTSDKAIVVLVALLITSLPALAPLTVRIVAPGPSVRLLTSLNQAISRHQHTIVVAVEVIFGVYLLAKGFGA
jgi:threonine/homoserine/homoserine lactone efflux protein